MTSTSSTSGVSLNACFPTYTLIISLYDSSTHVSCVLRRLNLPAMLLALGLASKSFQNLEKCSKYYSIYMPRVGGWDASRGPPGVRLLRAFVFFNPAVFFAVLLRTLLRAS